MLDDIEIKRELKDSFKKIFHEIPKKLQKNKYVLETATAYLKIGGERLAKQSIDVFKAIDKLESEQKKRKLSDEAFFKSIEKQKIKILDK